MGESTSDIGGYKVHPAASVFPLLTGPEYERLVKSIKANGLRVPIVVAGDKILDGRNRLRACVELGVEPRFTHFEGDDPLEHVVALNLDRRHLNESQRAMVANRIATLRAGRPVIASSDAFTSNTASQEEAAAMMNVSRPSVQRARKVTERAVPEAIEAVECGDLSVNAAAELSALPECDQRAVLEKAGDDMRSVPRLIREAIEGPRPKYQRPKDPDVAARDERILSVYHTEGLRSPKKTAEIVGCSRSAVQQALERAGLNTKARAGVNPLRALTESAQTTAFSWTAVAEDAPWEGATEEQRAAAIEALKSVRQRAQMLISRIEKASTEAA